MRFIALLLIPAGVALANHTTILEKKALTIDGARKVIAGAVAQAKKSNAAGVVAVVDDGGNLMAVERLDGTFGAGANIAIGKARTAALFKKPTKVFEDTINKGRTAMATLPDFTPLQGGLPLVLNGEVVGAVGVSGANSAAQDEEFALAGANALREAGNSSVRYFDSSSVAAAFEKGAVLFEGSERYMVHASRREAPGMVEVHEDDADIVYVLQGAATLITGGRLVESKITGPGEIRGLGVDGGEARALKAGDVVIIPAGTPHWFKEVTNPFQYYVVKVR
ncbi:MAG: heme-binding protein [Bryobacterales bacterium]|nr:heme-binding protein [Bryobacterales bacterium]